MKRIIETFRVYEYSRVTETDDEQPSLPPMPGATAYDTTGEEVITQVRAPGLAKCGPAKWLRAAGGK